VFAVKALDQQRITVAERGEPAFRCVDTALARKHQHRALNPRMVPRIVRAVEFCDP